MVRTVFALIAAAVFATACTTVPGDQATSATADTSSDIQITPAEQREADLRALDELTSILLAAAQSYEAAAGNEAAASLVRAGEAPSLYETLAEARQSIASEAQARVSQLDGEVRMTASAEGEGFFAVVNIIDALAEGPELVLAEALSGETYLVDTLRGYLADPAVSVETKTFFQEVLPGLRAERDAIALLVDTLPEGGLSEDTAEGEGAADVQETGSSDDEGEDAVEEGETSVEEGEDAAASADTTAAVAQS